MGAVPNPKTSLGNATGRLQGAGLWPTGAAHFQLQLLRACTNGSLKKCRDAVPVNTRQALAPAPHPSPPSPGSWMDLDMPPAQSFLFFVPQTFPPVTTEVPQPLQSCALQREDVASSVPLCSLHSWLQSLPLFLYPALGSWPKP